MCMRKHTPLYTHTQHTHTNIPTMPHTDEQYVWETEGARRQDNSVVVYGHMAMAPDTHIAAKFYAERADYTHEIGLYMSQVYIVYVFVCLFVCVPLHTHPPPKQQVGGQHVPVIYSMVAPPPPPTPTPWGALIMEKGDYSLADWLGSKARKGAPDTVKRGALKDVCDAVAMLHASQIVHRDLKPANVVCE